MMVVFIVLPFSADLNTKTLLYIRIEARDVATDRYSAVNHHKNRQSREVTKGYGRLKCYFRESTGDILSSTHSLTFSCADPTSALLQTDANRANVQALLNSSLREHKA